MSSSQAVFSGPAVTALGLAASRAVETGREDRLIRDPLARTFFAAASMDLPMRLEWPSPEEPVSDAERLHLHGSRYIGLRTRFYDDVLLRAADTGVGQGVLIGAGLDTRAFRLALPPDFHVFELDQPPLLAWKQTVLDEAAAHPRCARSWLGLDLREEWIDALRGRGFDVERPTAFIAEGLVAYLAPEEQLSLVQRIEALAASGSVLALDRITGDPRSAGRAEELSRRSGIDMSALLAGGESDGLARGLRALGWEVEETPVERVAARYGRDLSDPFAVADRPRATEPPWLQTSFVLASR